MQIITASERMAQKSGIKAAIFGTAGIGKTSLLRTLSPEKTLFFDLEAGDLAVEDVAVDTVQPRTWQDCQTLAALIGGPNPALRPEQAYSQAHYDHCIEAVGGTNPYLKYETVFIDSITVAGRLCFQWAQGQPEATSERTGKPDTRGAYGLHGREMMGWLSHLQHTRDKNIIFVGILDGKEDDYGRRVWSPQIEGSKIGRELPGIVDQVITMAEIKTEAGDSFRAFICHTMNQWGYPAKDRSGRLDAIEQPHLGKLFEKILSPKRSDVFTHEIPTEESKEIAA